MTLISKAVAALPRGARSPDLYRTRYAWATVTCMLALAGAACHVKSPADFTKSTAVAIAPLAGHRDATAALAASAVAETMVRVQVPVGAKEGDRLTVKASDGYVFDVAVPAGLTGLLL